MAIIQTYQSKILQKIVVASGSNKPSSARKSSKSYPQKRHHMPCCHSIKGRDMRQIMKRYTKQIFAKVLGIFEHFEIKLCQSLKSIS